MTYLQSSQLSNAFTSVPLTYVMLLVDTYWTPSPSTLDFASKTALSWAQNVPTLKHFIVEVVVKGFRMRRSEPERHGYEVIRTKDGKVELRSIASDELEEIKEEVNFWN
jgi:hypothetical protein